jgi:hypothetical protein
LRGSHLLSEPAAQASRNELLLSERQRRHVISFLLQLEGTLCNIERTTHGSSVQSTPLTLEAEDLPSTFARRARPQIRLLRQHLGTIVQRLELSPAVISRRKLVREEVAQCLLDLFDAGSHGLRGYGRVDLGTAAVLDSLLADLRAPLEGILKLLGPLAE